MFKIIFSNQFAVITLVNDLMKAGKAEKALANLTPTDLRVPI